ncbi:unnamed protein product [Lactuca saligna]|uniref:Uncharacterized protein n=1 Tax=Lactuca saligna TaxID=75948 RepID=A0AA36E3E3_LACSI|nr:unnamed protein product [Lactuca saligna]
MDSETMSGTADIERPTPVMKSETKQNPVNRINRNLLKVNCLQSFLVRLLTRGSGGGSSGCTSCLNLMLVLIVRATQLEEEEGCTDDVTVRNLGKPAELAGQYYLDGVMSFLNTHQRMFLYHLQLVVVSKISLMQMEGKNGKEQLITSFQSVWELGLE